MGIAPLIILQLLLLGFLMIFVGVIGEYIGAIYTQILDESCQDERINLD